MIILTTLLAVLGIGYLRSPADRAAGPARPVQPRIPARPGRFAAEAAAAAARLHSRADHAYTHTHLWQAASALSASIGYMQATGSRTYLSDLSATYRAHVAPGHGFPDHYYDDDGWWVLTWIRAYHLTGNRTYLRLVIDGLTASCRPKLSSRTWTYNQGVLIGALVSLARMTGHRSLLVTAGKVAHAVMRSAALSPGGILREPCRPLHCGRDAPMFKGIFMQNLKLLYDRVGGAAYQRYMRGNAAAVWVDDRRGAVFGISWAGPFHAPTMTAQASALDVLTTQVPQGPRPAPGA